jgi:hypothetical protein
MKNKDFGPNWGAMAVGLSMGITALYCSKDYYDSQQRIRIGTDLERLIDEQKSLNRTISATEHAILLNPEHVKVISTCKHKLMSCIGNLEDGECREVFNDEENRCNFHSDAGTRKIEDLNCCLSIQHLRFSCAGKYRLCLEQNEVLEL